jgi:uncharacterized protein with HEPN domain
MNQLQRLEWKSRLWHIVSATQALVDGIAGRTKDEVLGEDWDRAAVERYLITIGEALKKAIEDQPQLAARISDTQRIVGFRNQIVHNYPDINYDKVWDVLQTDLPRLLAEVRTLLDS